MDGYSRKILDWELCETMEGINIELLVARVKEKYPEAHARIIHDNGKQFISKDFKSLISLLELYETSARICHPQSNGKLERFHSTLKTEHVRQTAYFSYEDAEQKMAQWIDFYKNEIAALEPEAVIIHLGDEDMNMFKANPSDFDKNYIGLISEITSKNKKMRLALVSVNNPVQNEVISKMSYACLEIEKNSVEESESLVG